MRRYHCARCQDASANGNGIPLVQLNQKLGGEGSLMSNDPVQPAGKPGIGALAVSVTLAVLALALCGIPFVHPSPLLVVPAAVGSLIVLVLDVIRKRVRSPGRLIAAGLAVALDLFALYLSLAGTHLIDWLEGF
jgi:hypothetical protein